MPIQYDFCATQYLKGSVITLSTEIGDDYLFVHFKVLLYLSAVAS